MHDPAWWVTNCASAAPSTSATPARDAKVTSALLVEAFGDMGLERLAGRHPAWITIARNFLVEIGPPPVRPDRAVLQIGAYPAQDDLLGVLQQLSRSGYTLALDAYDGRQDISALMSLCSIVRVPVDQLGLGGDTLERAVELPRANGSLLVATGVSDHELFERCRDLGFTYFQGDWFAKPRLIRRRRLTVRRPSPARASCAPAYVNGGRAGSAGLRSLCETCEWTASRGAASH